MFQFESDMLHATQLRDLWQSFWWPGLQWCREFLLRFWECRFEGVPPAIMRKIDICENCMKTTLINENGGNKLRQRESAHVAKRMAQLEKYATLIRSPLLAEFDRNPIKPTPTSDACKIPKLPEGIFTAKSWTHSLVGEFDKLGGPATWPNVVHETRMLSFLSFASYLELDSKWDRHFRLWNGTFAVTNHLIFKADEENEPGVLSTTQ